MKPNKCKCNQTPYVLGVTDYMSDDILGYYVVCENCGQISRMAPTKDEAIEIWNEEREN